MEYKGGLEKTILSNKTLLDELNDAFCQTHPPLDLHMQLLAKLVYGEQFPLILAFAVTIHKCQGLSLDCAIVHLSSDILAYVALSRNRHLYVFAFDPKCIKFSTETECIEER